MSKTIYPLKDDILENIRWLDVRNAIKKFRADVINGAYFSQRVWAKTIRSEVKEIDNDLAKSFQNIDLVYQIFYEDNYKGYQRAIKNICDKYPAMTNYFDEIRKRADALLQILVDEKLLEKVEGKKRVGNVSYYGGYFITEKGHTFLAQKAIPRFSQNKGWELVKKIQDKANELNSETSTFVLDEIILIGSMLSDQSDVGDVDIICFEKRNMKPGETIEEFRERDSRQAKILNLKPYFGFVYSCQDYPSKMINRISPRISIANQSILEDIKEKQQPYKVIYKRQES